MKEIVKYSLTTMFVYIGYFLGGFDTLMITLLIFMALDYLTGIMVAIKKKKLCSKVGFVGIGRKVLILILVGMANLLGIVTHIDGIRYIVIAFYLANEGISIIENAGKFGIKIPKKLTEILEQLNNEGSDTNES